MLRWRTGERCVRWPADLQPHMSYPRLSGGFHVWRVQDLPGTLINGHRGYFWKTLGCLFWRWWETPHGAGLTPFPRRRADEFWRRSASGCSDMKSGGASINHAGRENSWPSCWAFSPEKQNTLFILRFDRPGLLTHKLLTWWNPCRALCWNLMRNSIDLRWVTGRGELFLITLLFYRFAMFDVGCQQTENKWIPGNLILHIFLL